MPKIRQKAAQLVYRGWSTRKVARHFGFSQSVIVKWTKKATRIGYHPIPTRSSRPKSHPKQLPKEIVDQIIESRLRTKRTSEVVHQELKNQGINVSLNSVRRTIDRHGLMKKRSPWKRFHPHQDRPYPLQPGDLVQIDTIHTIDAHGGRVYMYTLIDLKSRWAYAEVSAKIGTRESVRFVASAQAEATFPFKMVQSDHGSEFSKMFTFRLARMGMAHRHSRVRQSNDNAHIERFNRTIQEECTDKVPKALKRFRDVVPSYLKHYNTKRLHMGINYQTPLEVLRRC